MSDSDDNNSSDAHNKWMKYTIDVRISSYSIGTFMHIERCHFNMSLYVVVYEDRRDLEAIHHSSIV